MSKTTSNDKERIDAEMGENGDKRTIHPRMVCTKCQSFVYLVLPRQHQDGAVMAECDCAYADPKRGELPSKWDRINEYNDTRGQDDG